MTENYRLEFKQWNEFRRDFFGSFENGYQNRCVEKRMVFLTERNSIHSKFTIGLIPKMIKGA
jgi:hypothetical protein